MFITPNQSLAGVDFEVALKEEIHAISGLENNMFPLNAPESYPTPYLVYKAGYGVNDKSLSGVLSSRNIEVEFDLVCSDYEQMKTLTSEVVYRLQSFEGRVIGVNNQILVQEIVVEPPAEFWEPQLSNYKTVIDFKVNI